MRKASGEPISGVYYGIDSLININSRQKFWKIWEVLLMLKWLISRIQCAEVVLRILMQGQSLLYKKIFWQTMSGGS